MESANENSVAHHYGEAGLFERICSGLEASGIALDAVTPEDLAPVDEFHVGGRPATQYVVAKMGLSPDQHVLDVGCGIGGATRYLVSEIGCHVSGIDLTPQFIDVAEQLAELTRLSGKIDYEAASALDMPYDDESFDAAITLHVAMNIRDREGLYREVARVLKPGSVFCVYDIMKGEADGFAFPVPWADTPETSHLTTPDEMVALLTSAGFEVGEIEDRRQFAIDFFQQRITNAGEGPPPLGLHLLLGPSTQEKFANILANIENGCVSPVVMMAKKGRQLT
jgi:MPBQ/MSBQ methyltransferase